MSNTAFPGDVDASAAAAPPRGPLLSANSFPHSFIHLYTPKYLPHTTAYMPGTVPGTGDSAGNETEFPALLELPVQWETKDAKQVNTATRRFQTVLSDMKERVDMAGEGKWWVEGRELI